MTEREATVAVVAGLIGAGAASALTFLLLKASEAAPKPLPPSNPNIVVTQEMSTVQLSNCPPSISGTQGVTTTSLTAVLVNNAGASGFADVLFKLMNSSGVVVAQATNTYFVATDSFTNIAQNFYLTGCIDLSTYTFSITITSQET